jgi:hypothetical protein
LGRKSRKINAEAVTDGGVQNVIGNLLSLRCHIKRKPLIKKVFLLLRLGLKIRESYPFDDTLYRTVRNKNV